MYFIVSTGRSGSHAIVNVLNQVPGCHAAHEPDPQLIRISSEYRYGSVSENELKDALARIRERANAVNTYCESDQTLSLIIPVLAATFPEARFIWLIRNGLDQVGSAFAKQWYSGHSENHDRYEDCPPIERLWIDGRIEGDRCGDVSSEQWESMDRFARCCWYWSYVNTLIEADLNLHASGRYTVVRLEELDTTFPQLLRWMSIPVLVPPRVQQTNEGKRPPHPWTGWTEQERQIFMQRCGSLMDRCYPRWRNSEGWVGISYQKRSGVFARLGEMDRVSRAMNRIVASHDMK